MKTIKATVCGFKKGIKEDKKWTTLSILIKDDKYEQGLKAKEIVAFDNENIYDNVKLESKIEFEERYYKQGNKRLTYVKDITLK